MADEDEEKDAEEGGEGEEGEGGGGGKKKLIMLIVLGLVLVGLSVGGTLAVIKFLGGNEPEAEMDEMAEEVDEGPEIPDPAIYYPLKPPIIVNFESRGRQRYLQAELTLMTREEDVVAAIELHMPMIRNALVLLIGGQLFEEIQTAEGKELLRQQCLMVLQEKLQQEINKPGIEQVLFTNFVMQ